MPEKVHKISLWHISSNKDPLEFWRDKQEISFILDDCEPWFSAIHPRYHYRRFSFNPLILPSFFASVSPPVPATFAKKSLNISQSCSQRVEIKPRQMMKSGLSARTFGKCHLENTRATKKKSQAFIALKRPLLSVIPKPNSPASYLLLVLLGGFPQSRGAFEQR